MHSNIIIFISIVISLLTIIICGGLFLIYKKSERSKYTKKLDESSKKLNLNREAYFNALINRVDLVTKTNPRFEELNLKVSKVYDKLIDEINTAKILIRNIKHEIESNQFSPKNIKNMLSGIGITKNKIDNLADEFKDLSSEIIQQDEFIRNEFLFYQEQYRKVSDSYNKKMLQISRIKVPIEKMISNMSALEKDFNRAISVSDIAKANTIVKKYSTLILRFVKIVSEGSSIETYLYTTIPQLSKNIDIKYRKLKRDFKSPLNHIEYVSSMKKIVNSFEKAKKNYLALKIDNTKKMIIKILKGFKSIDNFLDFERISRTNFYANFNKSVLAIKKVLKYFVEIKSQYKDFIQKTPTDNTEDLSSLFKMLKSSINELDQDAINFRDIETDRTTPYSVKNGRMEIILGQTNWAIKLLNDFVGELWSVNIDQSIIRNKFHRADASINELIANLNIKSIKLDDTESKRLNELNELRSFISSNIRTKINHKIIQQINRFTEVVTSFYKMIAGKYEIAMHVQNMLNELAPLRATNDKLNFALKISEKNYLEGDYVGALNGIIENISKGV